VTLVPTSVSFGNQNVGTSSPPQTVTLTNTGTGTLTITSGKLGGADRADFSQSHNCVPNLAPGASCHIYVTFKPTKIGARSATVSMTDNAPGSPQTVSLSGTGTRRH